MKRKFLYSAPDCEESTLSGAFVLCVSPGDGGSEDVVYEDWNELVS